MIFSSGIFLWLFAAFIVFYLLLQRRTTARLMFVTLFSYYFYYKSSGTYFFLLAIVTVSDFFIARLMERATVRWQRKTWVAVSLLINLGLLCYFKYTNFLCGFFASLTGGTFTAMDIFLPVGISFFTFQSLSYTIDVYRKEITPLTNLLDYAFYVSFFPQLVAGPIVRARDFIPQIRRPLSPVCLRKQSSPIISVSTSWSVSLIILLCIRAWKTSWVFTAMRFKSIATSPDIAIWLSALLCCWAFIST